MAEKTKPFSIFLLKEDFNASNTLSDEHSLEEVTTATKTPNNSTLYILDSDPKPPWWKAYLGIVRSIVGQGLDVNLEISGVPRPIKESAVGSRFRIHIKEVNDGQLATNRSWPFEAV